VSPEEATELSNTIWSSVARFARDVTEVTPVWAIIGNVPGEFQIMICDQVMAQVYVAGFRHRGFDVVAYHEGDIREP
jgi:hypothetical protein